MESSVHSENLNSLNYAIVSYLFATAVRAIQVKKGAKKKYKSSCLIHCEVAKSKHEWQESLIIKIIEDIKHAFLAKANTDLHILDLESDAYESLKKSNELGNKYELIHEDFPDFGEVEAEVKRILEMDDYIVQVINSENPVSALLNDKGQLRLEGTANIFIGGNILDRGITIDNMLCFFYGRDPKKFQMDTVLQHARMYGARSKEDMACTRFFTTYAIYDVLKSINSIDSVMYDYLRYHQDKIQTDDFLTSMVIKYDKRVNATAGNKYTPANTKVVKPYMRILPKGFQTGDAKAIGGIIQKIDGLLQEIPGKKETTDDNPFFLMDYSMAVKIIELISRTYIYGKEWNNVGWEWNPNEMLTALEHSVFKTDGKIYCQVYVNRNMSRERENIYDPRGRFIDSPESGQAIAIAKQQAENRPVLTLLRQNGLSEQGWRDTPFYWPSLMLPGELEAGIFTVDDKKKVKKAKSQIKLDCLDNYPSEGISRQPRRSFLTFTQLHRTIWLQEQRVRSCCNLHITTIMRQFDKVLDKFGNLHQSDFPLSLIVIATGKVCLIITYQHLLGTHQFTVFKEFVQVAQVLILFLDHDDKLLCWIVQLCITQAASMSEIEYIIYRNDNLLINRPIFLEISEIISQSLYGLSCQSVRSLGHHHSDVDATVETQAHDAEECICLTALYLT